MLQAINDRIKGWLGIAVVAIIALPFAFWGIQSYTGNGVQQYAAKINGIEISSRELEYSVSQQRLKLLEQYNGTLPIEESQLKRQVLDQLINRKLIEMTTFENGYRISDIELSRNIKKIFSQDGEFNRILFDSVRQRQGKSAAQFENEIRNELRVAQMREGILKSGFATNAEARKIAELESQSREVNLVTFNLENFTKNASISEEEIKEVYEADSERYMSPEKLNIEYVELKSDELSDIAPVDEKRVKAMYEKYAADISMREKRKASHILLKVNTDKKVTRNQLEDFRKQLENGVSFEKIARDHSEDSVSAKQGGDLGWIEPGQMVKPFENALFSLEEGEISNVVESQFGMHLIKLSQIKREPLKPLAEMHDEFAQTLKKESAGNLFYDLSENMATTAFETPDSLGAVVDIMGLKLHTSDFFTREAGAGIASSELVRKAAFSSNVLQQGNNSDIIELSPDHVIVLRVNQHVASTALPFDDVKSNIENVLRLRKGHDLALASVTTAREKIESGQTLKSILSAGQKIEKPGPLTRKDISKVDRRILDTIFTMRQSKNGEAVVKEVPLNSGDVALVVLEKINKPENIDYSRVASIKRNLGQGIASREFWATVEAFGDSADISRNPKLLQ